jgi:hypothetical protein
VSLPHPSKHPKKREQIISSDLAMALDRTKTSDRSAILVLSAAVSACGKKVDDVVLSRSTLRRQRSSLRKKIADDIKETFSNDSDLTIHWDGKLVPDLIGEANVERLAILVSGEGKSKLLAVPKLARGTGLQVAEAVVECLENWNIKDSSYLFRYYSF